MNGIRKIAFLSTYPPRECGLATFTEDLVNEITLSVDFLKWNRDACTPI